MEVFIESVIYLKIFNDSKECLVPELGLKKCKEVLKEGGFVYDDG
jgi:hypothetical protein